MDIQNTVHVNSAFTFAQKKAISYRHEFITPEHLLSAFLEQSPFTSALNMCFCDTQELAFSLENYFTEELESGMAFIVFYHIRSHLQWRINNHPVSNLFG